MSGLTATYARALARSLPFAGARGDALPGTVLTATRTIERAALLAYDGVCGFRRSDAVPPTYPHVLGFGLALRLMTARDFPFAVLGLVHVADRIEQRRGLRAGETLALRVRAAGLADHPRGRTFEIVTEAGAAGEPVWEQRSTYLRRERGGGSGGGRAAEPDVPGGALWRVPPDAGRRYAAVSGDRNPIHTHPLAARLLGQRGAIAHGMWLQARCLAALEGRVPEACAVAVRFRAPVALGSRVAFASRPRDGGREFALRSARDGRTHLEGAVAPT